MVRAISRVRVLPDTHLLVIKHMKGISSGCSTGRADIEYNGNSRKDAGGPENSIPDAAGDGSYCIRGCVKTRWIGSRAVVLWREGCVCVPERHDGDRASSAGFFQRGLWRHDLAGGGYVAEKRSAQGTCGGR